MWLSSHYIVVCDILLCFVSFCVSLEKLLPIWFWFGLCCSCFFFFCSRFTNTGKSWCHYEYLKDSYYFISTLMNMFDSKWIFKCFSNDLVKMWRKRRMPGMPCCFLRPSQAIKLHKWRVWDQEASWPLCILVQRSRQRSKVTSLWSSSGTELNSNFSSFTRHAKPFQRPHLYYFSFEEKKKSLLEQTGWGSEIKREWRTTMLKMSATITRTHS